VSLPHLLVVDDSEAIVAYETAALSSDYLVTSATNGREALDKLYEARPAAVLLDLSMPEMTGDELLERMQGDPVLRSIPVIVVSSEKARGEASLLAGARAFLHKPIRAPELRAVVSRVLEEEHRRSLHGQLGVLFLGVGSMEFAIRLDSVREVVSQPLTQNAPWGPEYLSEVVDYRGAPVLVLDLAIRLGIEHSEPVQERKLIVVRVGHGLLALSVDRVREPEVFLASDVVARAQIGEAAPPSLADVLVATVPTARGPVPVVDPQAFFSPDLLARAAEALNTLASRTHLEQDREGQSR
jgi:CheY-like chemotaxis protein